MSDSDVLSRLLSFPAPACRCGADSGRHDPMCLFGLLREGAEEIEKLRAENVRLSAMTVLGAPGQLRSSDRNVWVRLMCYFGTDGVWNSDDDKADVAPQGLSSDLRAEIVAWKHSLDHIATITARDVDAFSTRALNVARRVKEEMPSWKVVYIDRTKSGADIRNKDYFEHEVTL
ncbi:conserved hypothetical protein [Candidatus Terasakiella magnetica]|nr:conserved hypothetical protein [Candidatus Terasakiella magnetica]